MHVARRTCEMRSVERTIDMFLCVLVQCNEKRGKMSIVFERKRSQVRRHGHSVEYCLLGLWVHLFHMNF